MTSQTKRLDEPQPVTVSESLPRGRKSASAFRTISEVADDLGVQQHVLRFWETKFSQIRPLKRGGGRRYYRPEDVTLLKRIHELLYTEGYTIRGVQKLLKEQGRAGVGSSVTEQVVPAVRVVGINQSQQVQPAQAGPSAPGLTDRQRAIIQSMLGDLRDLRAALRGS